MQVNKLHFGDAIKEMESKLDDKSVDIAIIDPPYNISSASTDVLDYKKSLAKSKNYKLFNEEWDKFDSIDHYITWTDQWLDVLFRKLKDDGSLFVFGSYHNIGLVNYVLQKQNRMIINDICWYKRNAVPNIACRRLQASYETILWVAKDKKYRFNYKDVKSKYYDGDSIKKKDKQLRNVWDIPTKAERLYKHPSKKPVKVYERCIDVAGLKDGVLLDCFAGSGTAALAAMNKNMNYVLIENSEEYCNLIERRIQDYKALQKVDT
tara:strand:- start:115 stop:906 length:792 start_codon:yes stop_codon:yes gene_type:complete